ncbi:MAG: YkgJ family cysteine cluster protein [Acidobacteria bacterium]|nr:YkgJ family cysteine cluster protein [Acidobacteriota bacterium]
MAILPAELARLAREKEAENLAFRRHLHAHPDRLHLIHEIGARVQADFDCTQCSACCRETRVELTPADLLPIARFLKLRPAEVRRLYTESAPDSTLSIAHTLGQCTFLHRGLCLIYDVRPPACRLFPYLTPHEASLGARPASIWRRAYFCPIVFQTIEELKHRTGFHPRA